MMERSFLFQLHGHMLRPGVVAPPDLFEEAFRSKYGRVRIFKIKGVVKESKEWVADPANRLCDVDGSWFCPGQYPPGLASILSRKKDFAQLEDFNRGEADEQYQKEYFEALRNPEVARQRAINNENFNKKAKVSKQKLKSFVVHEDGSSSNLGEVKGAMLANKPDQDKIDKVYTVWQDTEDTTVLWTMINQNEVEDVRLWLEDDPLIGFIRSKDGRGPMWWAFEARNQEVVKLLMKLGVPHTDKDVQGLAPVDLLKGNKDLA